MKNKYKITEVTDHKGNEVTSRIGAIGQFYLLADGVSCIFVYDVTDEDRTGKMMVTSRVQGFEVLENSIVVATENSIYRFEGVE